MITHEKLAAIPQWRSHKVVHAAKVVRCVYHGPGTGYAEDYFWVLEGGISVIASERLRARVTDQLSPVGGYYIRYEDGFESWSPKKPFVEGYNRLVTATEIIRQNLEMSKRPGQAADAMFAAENKAQGDRMDRLISAEAMKGVRTSDHDEGIGYHQFDSLCGCDVCRPQRVSKNGLDERISDAVDAFRRCAVAKPPGVKTKYRLLKEDMDREIAENTCLKEELSLMKEQRCNYSRAVNRVVAEKKRLEDEVDVTRRAASKAMVDAAEQNFRVQELEKCLDEVRAIIKAQPLAR